MSKNWMVIVNVKDGTEMKGVYPTKRAAQFISQKVKKLDRLPYFPKIVETTSELYPINNNVEEYLQHVEKRNNDMQLRKKVVQHMQKSK